MIRPALLLGLCGLCAALGVAAAERQRLYADLVVSDDSDGQEEQSAYVGWRRKLETAVPSQLGLRGGYRHFSDEQRSEHFEALRLDYALQPAPDLDARLHLDQFTSDHWSPTVGGAVLSWRPGPLWYWEASAERDIIDNAASAERELSLDSYALSTDYRLAAALTLVAGGLYQDISDDNRRKGGLLRLIYEPQGLPGFSLQLRGRRVLSEFRGQGYFSPDRLEEVLALAQLSRALPGDHWVLTGSAGGGVQRVDRGDATALFRVELAARGWFSDHLGLTAKTGCSNAGGLGNGSADQGYRYCHADLSLIWAW